MNSIYNIEPSLLDNDAIEELLHNSEYGKVSEPIVKETHIDIIKRSNVFSNKKLKLDENKTIEEPEVVSENHSYNDKNTFKIIISIIVLIIIIGLFIYVKKRHNKIEEDDLKRIAEKHQFDFFGEIRQKKVIKNSLIASEYVLYLCLLFLIIYMIKNIFKSTNELF